MPFIFRKHYRMVTINLRCDDCFFFPFYFFKNVAILRSFQTLNLGFNEIGPEGGLAIVAALENKHYIKDVQINGNQVSSCEVHVVYLSNYHLC